MDIFDVLTLIGGLCLFLFGMNIMGSALERSAGNKLENMIGNLSYGAFIEDNAEQTMNLHESLKHLRSDNADYRAKYAEYTQKYLSFV